MIAVSPVIAVLICVGSGVIVFVLLMLKNPDWSFWDILTARCFTYTGNPVRWYGLMAFVTMVLVFFCLFVAIFPGSEKPLLRIQHTDTALERLQPNVPDNGRDE
jgi:hypothetical protein